MHLVPAPAVRLMKRRVLSRPGSHSPWAPSLKACERRCERESVVVFPSPFLCCRLKPKQVFQRSQETNNRTALIIKCGPIGLLWTSGETKGVIGYKKTMSWNYDESRLVHDRWMQQLSLKVLVFANPSFSCNLLLKIFLLGRKQWWDKHSRHSLWLRIYPVKVSC
jgi:hypothetical protein